jgi:alpha-glucosidase
MKNLFLFIFSTLFFSSAFCEEFKLFSPDSKTEVTINIDSEISIIAKRNAEVIFSLNNISLDVEGQDFKSSIQKIKRDKMISVDQIIYPEIKEKVKKIHEFYNELNIDFKSNYSLTVRAYNNGVVYRFNTTFKDDIIVNKENFDLHFANGDSIIAQKSKTFKSAYETPYEKSAISELTTQKNIL